MMSVRPIQNFSIIIPVKRDDPFIERCIAAVLVSASSGHEIIVVLDGWETSRLDHFLSHRNIRIFTHSSAGPAVCRHFGALQSVQDWLCFLDSDVLVRPDTFEKAICALHGSGDDGLIGSYDDLPEAPLWFPASGTCCIIFITSAIMEHRVSFGAPLALYGGLPI